jgi:predicted amidohydrolase
MEVKIALAQYPITYHRDLQAWQTSAARWVKEAADQGAKLLVFPEYGSMELVSTLNKAIQSDLKAQLKEIQALLPDFMATYRSLAQLHQVIIVAPSFPVLIDGSFINRAYVFSPNGDGYQDKWFMTRFETESWSVSSGKKQLTVFETDWGRFGIQICFDIEFPIGAQILAQHGVDLIVAPSCTETLRGATRVHVGARARALEQQVYIGVSQTIGEALWSPAVDINYGYAAVYTSPDTHMPEEGILKLGATNQSQWLIQSIDIQKNRLLQNEAQVFNRKEMNRIYMSLNTEISMQSVRV